jgi:hypothetical protein
MSLPARSGRRTSRRARLQHFGEEAIHGRMVSRSEEHGRPGIHSIADGGSRSRRHEIEAAWTEADNRDHARVTAGAAGARTRHQRPEGGRLSRSR